MTTSFPEADIFGVKLVNNRPTKALITISNHDTSSLNVAFVAGSLLSTKPQAEDAPAWKSIVRNLTAVQYAVDVPAGETKELPFSFALDMQPQDVRVQLTAVVMNDKGEIFQVQAADEVAAVVEAPVSFFDPQMYVHLSTQPPLTQIKEKLTNLQHLPVPLPHRSFRWYPLLRLQDLDRGPLPRVLYRQASRRSAQDAPKGDLQPHRSHGLVGRPQERRPELDPRPPHEQAQCEKGEERSQCEEGLSGDDHAGSGFVGR